MSSFSPKKENSEISGGKFFPIACDTPNVTLTKISYEKKKDTYGTCFYWKVGDKELVDVIFNTTKNSPKLHMFADETREKAYARWQTRVNNKIRHIMSMFVGDETLENMPEAENLEQYTANIIAVLQPLGITKTKLYLKTIANKSNFATVPYDAMNPFVQKMSDGVCTLSYTEKEIAANEAAKEAAKDRGVSQSSEPDAQGTTYDDAPENQDQGEDYPKDWDNNPIPGTGSTTSEGTSNAW